MIGLFGGTFDPVHKGHITMAQELQSHLQLEQMHLLPCHIPPHRAQVMASPEHRLAMLKLATRQTPLQIDERELLRDSTSYTIDSLKQWRKELPSSTPLVLCMGEDSFATLPSWHRWQELLQQAHIAVATRPGHDLAKVAEDQLPELKRLLADRQTLTPSSLQKKPHGSIYLTQLSQIPLSSTQVRREIANRQMLSSSLHPDVIRYIEERGLYQTV